MTKIHFFNKWCSKILSNFCSNNFFKRELLESIIEITTDVCNDVDEIYNDIRPKIDMALEFSNDNNFELLSMPIHPFAKVSDQKYLMIKDILISLIECNGH